MVSGLWALSACFCMWLRGGSHFAMAHGRWIVDGLQNIYIKPDNCDNKPFYHWASNQYCGFLRFNISMILIILTAVFVVGSP